MTSGLAYLLKAGSQSHYESAATCDRRLWDRNFPNFCSNPLWRSLTTFLLLLSGVSVFFYRNFWKIPICGDQIRIRPKRLRISSRASAPKGSGSTGKSTALRWFSYRDNVACLADFLVWCQDQRWDVMILSRFLLFITTFTDAITDPLYPIFSVDLLSGKMMAWYLPWGENILDWTKVYLFAPTTPSIPT